MKKILLSIVILLFCNLQNGFAVNTLVANEDEFDAAVASATAGDTIKLKNGTWTDIILEFYAEGDDGNPVVLTAETAGEVILTGFSRLAIYGKYLEVSNLDFKDGATSSSDVISFRRSSSQLAENCRVTNCRILNYNPATDAVAYKWVSIYGANNRVDHCTFSGKNHEGALLVVWLTGSANYHRIDHNYFSDIPRLDRNGAETIRIGTSTNSLTESRSIVEHNVLEKCDGELEIISNKSGFNIYRFNTFINNNGVLTLRHGDDCEVHGNFFFGGSGISSGGVRIIGERHRVYNNYFQDLSGTGSRAAISIENGVVNSPLNLYFQVKDAEIVHNTIVSCRQAFSIGSGKSDERTLPPLDCVIANNVIDKVVGTNPLRIEDSPINMTYISNFFNFSNLSVSDAGLQNIDPKLVLEGNLWKTERAGPTTDAAVVFYNYVRDDMDGHERDDRPDIGSDEYAEQSITNMPLGKDDVGADWNRGVVSLNRVHTIDASVFTYGNELYVNNLPEENGVYEISILNMNGQLIQKTQTSEANTVINVNNLNGVFIVRIEGEEQAFFTKKVYF